MGVHPCCIVVFDYSIVLSLLPGDTIGLCFGISPSILSGNLISCGMLSGSTNNRGGLTVMSGPPLPSFRENLRIPYCRMFDVGSRVPFFSSLPVGHAVGLPNVEGSIDGFAVVFLDAYPTIFSLLTICNGVAIFH